MAKIEMDDGSVISSGHLLDKLERETGKISFLQMAESALESKPNFVHPEITKMKVPNGIDNRHRIVNTNTYDLLVHIQQSLSLNNRCIINLITNEEHKCLNTNDTIQRRIHQFAESYIDEQFALLNPRSKVKYKVEGTDNCYDERDETDEEWLDRLCHLMMIHNHPRKLQMIKCEECIYNWLKSSIW